MVLNMGPLLLVYQWWMGTSVTVAFRKLAGLITMTMQFIRCKTSFLLIDSASVFLHEPRSSFNDPVKGVNFSDHSPDLICSEVQLGSSHL